MGSSASKAVRKYPKGTELPRNVPHANRSKPVVAQNQLAESRRSEGVFRFCNSFFLVADGQPPAIERDAADPDFLSNLSRLGPVKVDHHMQTVRPVR